MFLLKHILPVEKEKKKSSNVRIRLLLSDALVSEPAAS